MILENEIVNNENVLLLHQGGLSSLSGFASKFKI